MKKTILGAVVALAAIASMSVPAFANVVFSGSQPGHPTMAGSNTGSAQGQAHRSATGTTAKMTNDGMMQLWGD